MKKAWAAAGWITLGIIGLILLIRAQVYFLVEFQFILEIILLTFLTRALGVRFGRAQFVGGLGFSALLLILLGHLFKAVGFNMKGALMDAWVMPFFEEIFKLLPVAALAVFFHKKRKIVFNPSDLLFLAVMAAAGFSLVEKFYWSGIRFDFTYGPHLGGWFFFPDALGIHTRSGPLGYVGHAAATGLVAMGIGLGIRLKRHRPFEKLYWVLPAAAFAWIYFEHALNNLYYLNGSLALAKIGGGRFTPLIFIGLLVFTLGIDLFETVRAYRASRIIRERVAFFRWYWKMRRENTEWPPLQFYRIVMGQMRLLNMAAGVYARRRHES